MNKFKLILVIFFPLLGIGQNYAVRLIPDSLLQDAHAVKRMEEIHLTIKSANKVIVKHKYAITILDEQGDYYSVYQNYYSSLKELNNIDGNLYDAAGKKIASVKRKDIQDVPNFDGFSLMLDSRIKRHQFYHRQYPYTIEYEEEEEQKETYFLPFWMPIEGPHMSVVSSNFFVEVPADFEIRTKQVNYQLPPLITKTTGTTYNWQLSNQKSIVQEPYQGAFKEILPMVYIGPNNFSIAGYNGQMQSWKSLGNFNVSLNTGRDALPENIKNEIHKLTDGISDRNEKINKVYQYLQQNTRYISIQLGIGGWQPFEAKYVAQNKYGDCKALTNYMVSLLKEVGIKANYVKVTAGKGRKGLSEDFPAPYFNHVICCVPGDKDTTWLECTSQTSPAGYVGSFTGNRKALLIGDDGGYVVNTPQYQAHHNQQIRKVQATLDTKGDLIAEVNTHFTGIQQEEAHDLIHAATKEEREKYLNQALSISTYQVDKFTYKEKPGFIPEVDEYLHITATGFANTSGKRIFILPNLFNQSSTKLSEDSLRKFSIQFNQAYLDIDTINIQLPSGYELEAGPKDITIQNAFGEFSVKYAYKNQQLTLIRYRKSDIKSFPAADYPKLVEFINAIYKADHSRMVFVKKEGT